MVRYPFLPTLEPHHPHSVPSEQYSRWQGHSGLCGHPPGYNNVANSFLGLNLLGASAPS